MGHGGRFWLTPFFGISVVALAGQGASATPLAFDNAGDPIYNDGWQSGDNGGYGFGPWALTNGLFQIRSSGENNTPPQPADDIDSPGGKSWAVVNEQALIDALASRSLLVPVRVGQTITIDFDAAMGANQEGDSPFGINSRARDFGFSPPPELSTHSMKAECTSSLREGLASGEFTSNSP
jgi:hypothetical protein